MTIDFDYYKRINGMYGVNKKRDAHINRIKHQIEQNFDDDILAFDVDIEGENRTILITYSSKEQVSKIISKPNETFNNGDIVTWDDRKYIVFDTDPDKRIYTKGQMRQCLGTIVWQDSDGEIHEAWFARKQELSANFGIDERSKILIMPDERRQIIVQSNVNTQKIGKDKRFILDGRAWKVITLDDIADGIINIVLQEDQINHATDNVELRVANYTDYRYTLVNRIPLNLYCSVGDDVELRVDVLRNGAIDESLEVAYLLDTSYSEFGTLNGNVFSPAQEGVVQIRAVSNGHELIFTIAIESIPSVYYTSEIIGDDTLLLGEAGVYTVVYYNNDDVINDATEFTITQTPSDLVTIVNMTDNSIDINTNSKSKTGTFTINALGMNTQVSTSKTIRVKGLI